MNGTRNVLLGTMTTLLLTAAGGVASPASVAADDVDPRWLPWLGCWAVEADTADGTRICVLPSDQAAAARILTIAGGAVIDTRTIAADGRRQDVREGECTGWESAGWSDDGLRLYLRGELHCDGLRQTTTGTFSMRGDQWIEVRTLERDGRDGSRSRRLSPAAPPAVVSPEITPLLVARELDIDAARRLAGRRLTADDVVDLVASVGEATTIALLVERRDRFRLNAAALVEMARRGVPGSVTDVLVALAYPNRFALIGPDGEIDLLTDDRPRTPATGRGPSHGYDPYLCPDPYFGFSPIRRPATGFYGPYGPLAYDPYLRYGRGRYAGGCPAYGYGGRQGWSIGLGSPRIEQRLPRARAVAGRGYTRPGDAAETGRARPRGGDAQPPAGGVSPPQRPPATRNPPESPPVRRAIPRTGNSGAGQQNSGSSGETRRAVRRNDGTNRSDGAEAM